MTQDEAARLMVLVNLWRTHSKWMEGRRGHRAAADEVWICANELAHEVNEMLKASGEGDGT